MKTVFTGLMILGLTAPVAVQQPNQPRPNSTVAYVSVQKVLSESAAGKAAAKQIEDFRRAKAEEVSRMQKALEATRLELANAGGLFQGSRRAELQAKEKREQTALQQAVQHTQGELQKLQQDLQSGLQKALSDSVGAIAKKRGVQLVLNTDSAVVWAATGVDITADVLALLRDPFEKPAEKTDKKP